MFPISGVLCHPIHCGSANARRLQQETACGACICQRVEAGGGALAHQVSNLLVCLYIFREEYIEVFWREVHFQPIEHSAECGATLAAAEVPHIGAAYEQS